MTLVDPPQSSGDHLIDPSPAPSIETGWTEDRATFWVSGEVDLVTASRLDEGLTAFCSISSGLVVVDVSRLSFMSVDGLAVLVNTHGCLLACGREGLLVVGASGITKRLFTITGLAFLLHPEGRSQGTGRESATQQGLDFRGAREAAELSVADLFVAYFALGGTADFAELKAFLAGQTTTLDTHQRDVAAHAVNERLVEVGSPERMLAYSSAPTTLRAG